MPRRVTLPTADDLFRPTADGDDDAPKAAVRAVPDAPEEPADERPSGRPSGRIRHDEKMTVYVTADELLDLEHARLSLRRNGLTVDRGRLVREAIAIALADLEENGDESVIAQRLKRA